MMNAAEITDAIATVAPIVGVSFGVFEDPSTWVIQFADGATSDQRSAAAALVATLNPSAAQEADYTQAIQAMIDTTAQGKKYTNGETVAKYALLPQSPQGTMWKEEGQAFVEWVASVWAYAFQQLALVQSGGRAQPTVTALIAEIGAQFPMKWPTPT